MTAFVCEACDREKRPEEHDWVIGSDGEDLCALCAETLDRLEREAIGRLPKRIGSRPEHAPEFYYPLGDGEGFGCPQMVVYEQAGSEERG